MVDPLTGCIAYWEDEDGRFQGGRLRLLLLLLLLLLEAESRSESSNHARILDHRNKYATHVAISVRFAHRTLKF